MHTQLTTDFGAPGRRGRQPLIALIWGLLTATAILAAGPATADEPFDLPDTVVDRSGVLEDESRVRSAVEDLRAEAGIDLYVVYVDDFAGLDGPTWATRSAEATGLPDSAFVLAIAVQERRYGTVYDSSEISDSRADEVAADLIEPALREDDWDGAAIAAAEGYQDDGSNPWVGFAVVLGVLLVPTGGLVAYRQTTVWGPRKRRTRAFREAVAHRLGDIDRQILALDDALDRATRDQEYARAEFGEQADLDWRQARDGAGRGAAEAHEKRTGFRTPETGDPQELPGVLDHLDEVLARAHRQITDQQARDAAARDLATSEGASLRELAERLPALGQHLADLIAALPSRVSDQPAGMQTMFDREGAAGRAAADRAADVLTEARQAWEEGATYRASALLTEARELFRRVEGTTGALADPESVVAKTVQRRGAALHAVHELEKRAVRHLAALPADGTAPTFLSPGAIPRLRSAVETASGLLATGKAPEVDPRERCAELETVREELEQLLQTHDTARKKRNAEAAARARVRRSGNARPGRGRRSGRTFRSSNSSSSGSSRGSGGGRF